MEAGLWSVTTMQHSIMCVSMLLTVRDLINNTDLHEHLPSE